jgi:hypothetical protein
MTTYLGNGGLRTWLNQWSLAHIGEEGEHRVEGREFPLRTGAVLDAGEQLGEDGQVQNEGRRQKRVLERANVSTEKHIRRKDRVVFLPRTR